MWTIQSPQRYETWSDIPAYVTIDESLDNEIGNVERIRIEQGWDAQPIPRVKNNPTNDEYILVEKIQVDEEQLEIWRLKKELREKNKQLKLLQNQADIQTQLNGEKRFEEDVKRQNKKRERILENRTPKPIQEELPVEQDDKVYFPKPVADNQTKFVKKGSSSKDKKPANKSKKTTYHRNWRIYNQGQYNEYKYFSLYASELANTICDSVKKSEKGGRPAILYRDLVTSVLIITHYNLSGRRARALIHEAWINGYLTCEPAPTTIWKFMNSEKLTDVLKMLLQISATPAVVAECEMAVDSSGFRTSSYTDWFGEKHKYVKYNEWLKLHIIGGIKTHIIAKAEVTTKDVGDNPMFKPLVDGVIKYFKVRSVMADKAYSARSNYTFCKKHGIQLFIPFKCNATGKAKGSIAWAEAYALAQSNPDFFEHEYHKRSNVETIFHMMKATGSETIKSKKTLTQTNELYCKAITHNIRMLIMMLSRFKVIPSFVDESKLPEKIEKRLS